ncbi:MAG: aminoacyl-histidine dipeptidase [Candidatus Latescibacterota bacterium]
MPIRNLQPKLLWKHFDEIRKIPHESGNEAGLREYVLNFARDNGFEAKTDKAGNVVVQVPASAGHESAPAVILQGHMDMVCEKNSNVEFDFAKDPIQLRMDGDWLTAKGTTLGADNGIGLAAALAVAEGKDEVHGPLELLCTVDEEVGLTGAGMLTEGFVTAKRLLNLDSEELGALYIGCAGGGDSTVTLSVSGVETPGGLNCLRLKVSGLRGGHSGIDIHEQRGNAIKILARILWKATYTTPLFLAGCKGGNKRNAIPREAEAVFIAPQDAMAAIHQLLELEASQIKAELGGREPELTVELIPEAKLPAQVMDEISQKTLLDLLLAIPHGVEAMSYDIPGLVETSNNLATVSADPPTVIVGTSSRSSSAHALQAVRNRIRAIAELASATVVENEPYPGWKPNLDSELIAVAKRINQKIFGSEPELKAIHAGLECGIIGEKYPGMDMISFGPHIEHPHSPEERVNVPSVDTFYKFLQAMLEELA